MLSKSNDSSSNSARWMAPPPPWPRIKGPEASVPMNLMSWRNVDLKGSFENRSSIIETASFGVVLSLEEMCNWLS